MTPKTSEQQMARPKKAEPKMDTSFQVRCTKDEKKDAIAKAHSLGFRTLSDAIRKVFMGLKPRETKLDPDKLARLEIQSMLSRLVGKVDEYFKPLEKRDTGLNDARERVFEEIRKISDKHL